LAAVAPRVSKQLPRNPSGVSGELSRREPRTFSKLKFLDFMATTNDSGISSLFSNLIGDAFKFATPFAQKLVGTSSTPAAVQADVIKTAALNGSGPNDPTLAKQAPLGILDFITGKNAATPAAQGSSGLRTGGTNWTLIAIVAAVVVGVVLFFRK